MKLFIVAALVSVAAAARLEGLERGYLPPNHSHVQSGFGSQGFGSQGSFGSSPGSFDSNAIDSAGAGSQGFGSAFPGATSNQYLPPNHGASGSSGQFRGSLNGFQRPQTFGGSQYSPNQYRPASLNQYGSASPNQYGSPSLNQYGSASPNQYSSASTAQSRYQQYPTAGGASQFPAASRQYLAPKSSSNYPQQPFDEQTGYHY